MASVVVKSNLGVALNASQAAIERAADIIGGMAESYAKQNLTDSGAVDTGNLRNSVAHAVANGGHSVVIGSNVMYAPFIELGTSRMGARPYLRPAIEGHSDEYRNVLQEELKNG